MPLDNFSFDYDATHRLLVGHWLRSSDEEDVYPSYQRLLAAAKAHGNCRFWLLDMRLRHWSPATFTKWFSELLTNEAVREVGSPIFVACVAAEDHRTEIEDIATAAMLRQSAQVEFYPFFFNNEAAAREWLAYYQSHPNQNPPTPVA